MRRFLKTDSQSALVATVHPSRSKPMLTPIHPRSVCSGRLRAQPTSQRPRSSPLCDSQYPLEHEGQCALPPAPASRKYPTLNLITSIRTVHHLPVDAVRRSRLTQPGRSALGACSLRRAADPRSRSCPSVWPLRRRLVERMPCIPDVHVAVCAQVAALVAQVGHGPAGVDVRAGDSRMASIHPSPARSLTKAPFLLSFS